MRLTRAQLDAYDRMPWRRGDETRYLCVECHGDRKRDNAHRVLSVNERSGEYHCFRCQLSGRLEGDRPVDRRIEKRSGRRWEPKMKTQAKPTARQSAQPAGGGNELQRHLRGVEALAGSPGAAYLWNRGISAESAHESGVRYHPAWGGHPSVVFPIRDKAGQLVAAQGRRIDPTAQPKAMTYGPKQHGVFAAKGGWESDVLILVEGPIDAMSLAAAGYPALAVMGCDLPEWLAWECEGKRVLVASDEDTAGERAAEVWLAALAARGADARRLVGGEGEDWNDLLVNEGPGCLRHIVSGAISSQWPRATAGALEVEGMTLRDFASSGQVVRVQSEILGEVVHFVADNAPEELERGAVVYHAEELQRLIDADPDAIRIVHAVKKIFDGIVLPEGEPSLFAEEA